MQGIFTGIQNIINSITSLVSGLYLGIQFLIGMVKNLIEMIKMLATMVLNTNTIITTMPSWLMGFLALSVSVSVLYVILGREQGK